jgi:type IV secretory pathway protease TraF
LPIIIQASSRRLRRGVLTALAVAIGSLAIAATASAAQLDVTVFCEPVGNYQISCETEITGGTAPYAIKWYTQGRYMPWWETSK